MSDPSGTWELVYTHDSESVSDATKLTYANGVWVGFIYEYATAPAPVAVTSSDNGESWTRCTFPSTSSIYSPTALAYGDGTWVLISWDYILTATDPAGTWTLTTRTPLTTPAGTVLIGFDGTYWVETADNKVYTATSPTGARTLQQTYGQRIWGLQYFQGEWVVMAQFPTTGRLFTATNPTGTWTQRSDVGVGPYWVEPIPPGVLVSDGSGYRYVASSLDGPWTMYDDTDLPDAYGKELRSHGGDYLQLINGVTFSGVMTATTWDGPYFYSETDPTPYYLDPPVYGGSNWLVAGWWVGPPYYEWRYGIWKPTNAADGWGVILS